jgi:hypothetical protein
LEKQAIVDTESGKTVSTPNISTSFRVFGDGHFAELLDVDPTID